MIVRSDNNIAYDNVMTPVFSDRVIADGGTIETLTEVEEVLSDLGGQNILPSLVWVAGGSKVGKTYSVIPENGSGDFTCVRATTPNRVNKDGDTEVVPINTPVIDWTTGSPLLIVSAVGEITFPSSGLNTLKSIVLNDKVKFYETGTESAYQIPIGSYSRLLTFDRIITAQEMIDLGVTEDTSTSMLLNSTGTGAGVSTLRLQVSSDMTVTLDGTGKFYTDAAGTIGESSSWTITAGALRTIYIRVPIGSATLNIPNRKLITKIGSLGIDGWSSATNAPSLTITPASFINVTEIRIGEISTIPGALPTKLIYFRLLGININWTYSGALPTGLTSLYLSGININWTYSGALPTGLTSLYLSGININWTGLNIGNNGNLSVLLLSNYRIAKMTDSDLVTLLNQMASRTGSLPASATINDLANPTSTDGAVLAALANLQTVKGTTIVRGG